MANENAILTALGLDISQYEKSINKATQLTQAFVQVGNDLDGMIRQIPLIGFAWEVTGGKIVDAFADMRTAARDFQVVMNAATGSSLTASLSKLGEVQKQIKANRDFNLSRSIAESAQDPLGVMKRGMALVGLGKFTKGAIGSEGEIERNRRDIELTREREKLLERITELYKVQEEAQSSIISGSQKLTQSKRLEIERDEKLYELSKEVEKRFPGTDEEKKKNGTFGDANKLIESRGKEIEESYQKQLIALDAIDELRKEGLQYQEKSNEAAADGLNIDRARIDVAHALQDLRIATDALDKEAVESAQSQLIIAQENLKVAEREQGLKEKSAVDEAKLSRLRLTGTQSEQNQQAIKNKYDIPIQEAIRRGDTTVAGALISQQADEFSTEATRQRRQYGGYGRGRSIERQTRNAAAREDRINQSNDRISAGAQAARTSPLGGPDTSGGGFGIDADLSTKLGDAFKNFGNLKTPNRGGVGNDNSSPDAGKPAQVTVSGLDDKLSTITNLLSGANGK